ncbi:hypothetical protein [Neokomagataea tanensis]|nr:MULTISPECIES: hypothetical protein [Neokomagataea]
MMSPVRGHVSFCVRARALKEAVDLENLPRKVVVSHVAHARG